MKSAAGLNTELILILCAPSACSLISCDEEQPLIGYRLPGLVSVYQVKGPSRGTPWPTCEGIISILYFVKLFADG
ncbi:hypothetical protein DFH11DRAFT_1610071 [Phellopilus nigrolimitatus]|nr:hypothetical protein DFH11DRAFT_1610071 [Phellopilus nigrolimitatus]